MSSELSVDLAVDSSKAVRGVKDFGKALEGTVDDLKDISQQGDRTEQSLEQSFREVARAAKKSGDDAGESFRKPMSDNVGAFKEEAIQNFSEVASSFKGDAQSMADGLQGLSGGLASALTPGIGIPLAILGAAAAAFAQSWADAAEDSKQRVSDMYNDFIESGALFTSENLISQSIQTIQEDTGKWGDAQQRVKDTGQDIGTVLRAMAGDQEAIATIHAAYVKKRDDEVAKIRASKRPLEEQQTIIDGINTKFSTQSGWISQIQKDTNTATDKALAYRDAMRLAGDEAGKVAAKVAGIDNRTATIRVAVDSSAYDRWTPSTKQVALLVNPVLGTAGISSPYKQRI